MFLCVGFDWRCSFVTGIRFVHALRESGSNAQSPDYPYRTPIDQPLPKRRLMTFGGVFAGTRRKNADSAAKRPDRL